MEFKDIKSQMQNLLLLGYKKDEIIKMVQTAPTIFRYTPDGIKEVLNSISEENFLANNTQLNVDINDSDTHHKTR